MKIRYRLGMEAEGNSEVTGNNGNNGLNRSRLNSALSRVEFKLKNN